VTQVSKTTEQRRRLGAWYTPHQLVEQILDIALEPLLNDGPVRVLDPACGDGRFLLAATSRLQSRFGLTPAQAADWVHGIDLDPEAVRATNQSLGAARAVVADGLAGQWPAATLVVGNPPFLGQMRRRTARAAPSHGYADAAALFFARAVEHAEHVALVLPRSLLATRDAGPVRQQAMERGHLWGLWLDDAPQFDAATRVCVAFWRRSSDETPPLVARWQGEESLPDAAAPAGDSWSSLLADEAGVPPLPEASPQAGTLAELAAATADFRDQYYGLAGAVSDDADGPPLVTSGLVDPACSLWGARTVRFTKRQFQHPRVGLNLLSPSMRSWATRRLTPKVLLATQTSILEAVADPAGEWLPSVPVISVIPHQTSDVWRIAAVLLSPSAAVWAAHQCLGAGLGPSAIKLRANQVKDIPLPQCDLQRAAKAIQTAHEQPTRRLELLQEAGAITGGADTAAFQWWARRLR
jgi:hypothetical protein